MVQRTKKEFKDYNDFRDRPFGLKWNTAFALDDLMKDVHANEEYALKNSEAKKEMTRDSIDAVLSESFLKSEAVTIQLNLLDEFGRLVDELHGYFKGEAYQDYFVVSNQVIYWDTVRHIEIQKTTKWFNTDLFTQTDKQLPKQSTEKDLELQLEQDENFQPFYEEGDNNG